MSAQDIARWLDTAHLPGAVQRYLKLTPFDQEQVTLEVARWERIREGHHARPDQLPIFHNNPQTREFPQLFGPKEQHYPEETPEMVAHGNKVFENIAKETMTAHLQRQMGTDADLPLDPPTLRDNIEAAWTAHSPKET
jgi:hypothetical protein